jgi:hypothetical protein
MQFTTEAALRFLLSCDVEDAPEEGSPHVNDFPRADEAFAGLQVRLRRLPKQPLGECVRTARERFFHDANLQHRG